MFHALCIFQQDTFVRKTALRHPSSNSACFVHAVLFKYELYSTFPTMNLLLKLTVSILALLLKLCSKPLVFSRSEGKDECAQLALICPWLMLWFIVSKKWRKSCKTEADLLLLSAFIKLCVCECSVLTLAGCLERLCRAFLHVCVWFMLWFGSDFKHNALYCSGACDLLLCWNAPDQVLFLFSTIAVCRPVSAQPRFCSFPPPSLTFTSVDLTSRLFLWCLRRLSWYVLKPK